MATAEVGPNTNGATPPGVAKHGRAAGRGEGDPGTLVYLLPGADADVLALAARLAPQFRFEVVDDRWLAGPPPAAGALLVRGGHDAAALRALAALRDTGGPPVLALLRPEELDQTAAYRWHDFALWPWDAREVAVRLRRLTGGDPSADTRLRWGDLVLDEERHEAAARGVRLDLTYTEFRLLALLLALRGRVVTRERAYRDIWATDHFGGLRTVDVHIRRLRSKLEAHGCAYIATVRNVGYRLREVE